MGSCASQSVPMINRQKSDGSDVQHGCSSMLNMQRLGGLCQHAQQELTSTTADRMPSFF